MVSRERWSLLSLMLMMTAARKIRESKRLIRLLDLLYDASRSLFPEFGRDFAHEDTQIHRENFIDLRDKLDTKGFSVGSKVLGGVHRVRDRVTAVRTILYASQEMLTDPRCRQ